MARRFLLTASVTGIAAGLIFAATPAYADELTTFTAAAEPIAAEPGDTVTITLSVTNEHHRKITYDTIVAPEELPDCAQDVGTLVPHQTEQVQCSAVVTDTTPETVTFSIVNAESEHNDTSATATVDIIVQDEPEEPEDPKTPETPVSTPP